ncbi:hypothetical protein B0H14DRAFT_3521138 [Mycena olivaceomarginata]|nr:hypothetical protein B0H14DRAFT_3521138 [Mycena olivaceomarginata]
MARKKTGQAPGRKSDFTGRKYEWLDGFRDAVRDATGDPGTVYTDVTKAFLLRYGYDLPFGENGILGTMQTMSGPGARPRLKPAISVYSKLHYVERIKPGFDASWKGAKEILPQSARIAMSQDYLRGERDEMHEKALGEWQASRQVPEKSPEDYHNAMETLSDVGIPMADALAERLGSHVVILVVGPVGSEKGEVCLRTYVSIYIEDLGPIRRKGFTAMEASITRYGRAAFGKEQCQQRGCPLRS